MGGTSNSNKGSSSSGSPEGLPEEAPPPSASDKPPQSSNTEHLGPAGEKHTEDCGATSPTPGRNVRQPGSNQG